MRSHFCWPPVCCLGTAHIWRHINRCVAPSVILCCGLFFRVVGVRSWNARYIQVSPRPGTQQTVWRQYPVFFFINLSFQHYMYLIGQLYVKTLFYRSTVSMAEFETRSYFNFSNKKITTLHAKLLKTLFGINLLIVCFVCSVLFVWVSLSFTLQLCFKIKKEKHSSCCSHVSTKTCFISRTTTYHCVRNLICHI